MSFCLRNLRIASFKLWNNKPKIHHLKTNFKLLDIRCPRFLSVASPRYGVDSRVKSFLKDITNRSEEHTKSNSDDLLSRLASIDSLLECAQQFKRVEEELEELKTLVSGETDPELQKMANEDLKKLEQQLGDIADRVSELAAVSQDMKVDGVVLEVTAGVGGQEAMLFCNELFDMYYTFSEFQGWEPHLLKFEKTEIGGARHASISINSPEAYDVLKFEGGVHRVQRVPKTEKAGRIHTSTASVAILPRPSEVSVQIDPKDLKIDTKRASGAGGQHVNTTESAVRLTHLPTGIVVECQTQRSQLQNRALALETLRAKLFQMKIDAQVEQAQTSRKLQVGSKARSEKIRTYNYPQDRITDHRINVTVHNLTEFMKGGPRLQELLEKLHQESRKEQLEEILRRYET